MKNYFSVVYDPRTVFNGEVIIEDSIVTLIENEYSRRNYELIRKTSKTVKILAVCEEEIEIEVLSADTIRWLDINDFSGSYPQYELDLCADGQ